MAIETDTSLLLLGWPGPGDLRARMVGASYAEIIAATSVPVVIAALQPDSEQGRVIVYADRNELAPGNLRTVELALELAGTVCRRRDVELIIGPVSLEELTMSGLHLPQRAEHGPGAEDLEEWAAAVSRPGDLVVVPIHDSSIGPAAIALHRSGRSVLAVSQNPQASSGAVVSPMNLPVGRSMGA